MSDQEKQRTVLVTGATSGIGRAVAAQLLEQGHAVVGVGRDFAKAGLGGALFEPVGLDLAELDTLPARLETLARAHPRVDALVLAAGRGELGGFEETSYAQIRALLDLNLTATVFVARAFLPVLKRHGHGDVVFLGSEAARRGGRRGAVYCASKFALRGLAQALREECAKSGVRVAIVNPGMVRTPFFDGLEIAPGAAEDNALRAEEVAAAIVMILGLRPGVVIDELDLSPLKRVVEHRRGRGELIR